MLILGINQHSHDAAVAVLDNGQIVFAAHAERYSKKKNDFSLNKEILIEALDYGLPDLVAYYEKPFLKNIRMRMFGGIGDAYKKLQLGTKTKTVSHHKSHAAGAYYSSPFNKSLVIVVDAIGEFETTTAWMCNDNKIKKIYSNMYPFSFGLFYSAFTSLIGLKPNEEEYIMMGMAGYGDKTKYKHIIETMFPAWNIQTVNFHYGIDWKFPIISDQDKADIAAAVQSVFENRMKEFLIEMQKISGYNTNLIISGGCALNATNNGKMRNFCERLWIPPNPGDAGSSLGAASAVYGKKITFHNSFLGTDCGLKMDTDYLVSQLLKNGIVANCSGRAEYGPRALGNRSIFADASLVGIKDKVNEYKGRESFRPFGCAIMEECASEWFDISYPSQYMKETFKCMKPSLIPGVVHVDGTTRVQTVNKSQNPELYNLLFKWKTKTGIPLLLNTSLNIKGQPLLNDLTDVKKWNINNPKLQIKITS